MTMEKRVFIFCLLVAASLHAFGMVLLSIKEPEVLDWGITEVSFFPDILERTAPPEFTAGKPISAPSFISLPENSVSLKEKMFINVNQIRYFGPAEADDYFKEAQKLIAQEAYYFEPELPAEHFLPLEENQLARYQPFPLIEEKSGIKTLTRYKMEYQGKNKALVERQFSFLTTAIEKWKVPPPSQLVILVSFSKKNEVLHCQIDQTSGNPEFDQNILRLFQSTILPSKNRLVEYRGRFMVMPVREEE
jgi:hypothetical protein